METAIATPARHVVSVVPEVQGDYGRNRYAFAAYNPDNTPAFNSRLWAAGPEAAEREVRRFVQSLIDADLLSPDWADFDIDLPPHAPPSPTTTPTTPWRTATTGASTASTTTAAWAPHTWACWPTADAPATTR